MPKRVSELEIMMKKFIEVSMRNQILHEEFVKEMQVFKTEMNDFKNESQISARKYDKQNAQFKHDMAIALKHQGTLVENMVAPDARILSENRFHFKPPIVLMVRPVKYKPDDMSQIKEFDVIVVNPCNVLLVECKNTPRTEYVREFTNFIKSGEFFEFYPEHKDKTLIPVFASLYFPENIIKYLSKNKIYAMGLKGDIMDILNMTEE